MIKACAGAGDFAQAEHLMWMMLKAVLRLAWNQLQHVIMACAEAVNVAKAEHRLCMMLNAGVEANTKSATAP